MIRYLPKGPGVYRLRNRRNGKVYVGQSGNIQNRWWDHLRDLRSGRHQNPHLQSAWDKYGEGLFEVSVLALESDPIRLCELERDLILRLRANEREFGYNINLVVRTGGYQMSEDVKRKIGAANRGKVRTSEMRAHLSRVKAGQGKGRVKSPQEIANLKKAWERRGPTSPDTLRKMSEARKGVPWTPARRKAEELRKVKALVV